MKAKSASSFSSEPFLTLICGLGLLLSVYALYVEHMHLVDNDFEALCDISAETSCSDVFSSKQGKVFSYLHIIPENSLLDQPNAFYGSIYYLCFVIFHHIPFRKEIKKTLLMLASTGSMILSSYLAYTLAFELHKKCFLCFSTYICNFILFLLSSTM
jgi:uncharacterized membrane protein